MSDDAGPASGGVGRSRMVDDAFVVYDECQGPELDEGLWQPAQLPVPSGSGTHMPLDPASHVRVGEGHVRVEIPRFSLSHDTAQSADSAKYLVFSTRRFALASDRATTFAVEMAVENVGSDPADYRYAMAAFHVLDLDDSTRVFSVCGTSTRILALHEQLGFGQVGSEPFFHVVESPYADFDDDFTRLRFCEVTLDRSRSTATWRVERQQIYALRTPIPDTVQLGFGIWTMIPIRHGKSRSLIGQGLTAAWKRFRVSGDDGGEEQSA